MNEEETIQQICERVARYYATLDRRVPSEQVELDTRRLSSILLDVFRYDRTMRKVAAALGRTWEPVQ